MQFTHQKLYSTVRNINMRVETHGDERRSAADLALTIQLDRPQAQAMLEHVDPGAAKDFLDRLPESTTSMRFSAEAEDHKVEQVSHVQDEKVLRTLFASARLCSFAIAREGDSVYVWSFTIKGTVEDDTYAHLAKAWRDEAITIRVTPKQQQLEFGKKGEKQKQKEDAEA
jgi:hypothetical protein